MAVRAPDLDTIRRRLSSAEPAHVPSRAEAAVAVLLVGTGCDLEVCFIRRAERAGDRWSGQIAFPGGRPSHEDATLRATAERETREEVGIDLACAEWLGALPAVPIYRGPGCAEGHLHAFSYYLGSERPPVRAQADEVAEVFWRPLAVLYDLGRRGTLGWAERQFPVVDLEPHRLWGLTLRVCEVLSEEVGAPAGFQWPSTR